MGTFLIFVVTNAEVGAELCSRAFVTAKKRNVPDKKR